MSEHASGGAGSGGSFTGPGVMLLSAAIFGYFGFSSNWGHQYTNTTPPQHIAMVAVLEWTMRGGAVAFLLAALLTMARLRIGDLLFLVAGLLTAVLFLVVAVWEWTNPKGYSSGVSAFLLIVFAAWNGYGSWQGLRDLLAVTRRDRPAPPAGDS